MDNVGAVDWLEWGRKFMPITSAAAIEQRRLADEWLQLMREEELRLEEDHRRAH